MKKLVFMLVLVLAGNSFAADKVITIQSKITGSQEQPRVISIVPWQDIAPPQYMGEELQMDLSSDVFKPIHRDEFVSEVQYISATRK